MIEATEWKRAEVSELFAVCLSDCVCVCVCVVVEGVVRLQTGPDKAI